MTLIQSVCVQSVHPWINMWGGKVGPPAEGETVCSEGQNDEGSFSSAEQPSVRKSLLKP